MSWNLEQETYLSNNYGVMTSEQIAVRLDKKPDTVRSKANRMGLKRMSVNERVRIRRERELARLRVRHDAIIQETRQLIDNTLQRLGV